MGQNNQEYRLEHWATCLSVRSFARTAHSFACSAAALIRSLAHSLTPSLVGKWMIRCLKTTWFCPTVPCFLFFFNFFDGHRKTRKGAVIVSRIMVTIETKLDDLFVTSVILRSYRLSYAKQLSPWHLKIANGRSFTMCFINHFRPTSVNLL